MELKSISNSEDRRRVLIVAGLIALALIISGAMLWVLVIGPSVGSSGIEANAKQISSAWSITDVELSKEGSPVSGLPSETLSFRDDSSNIAGTTGPAGILRYPLEVFGNLETNSVVNVSTFYKSESGRVLTHPDYTFKFYAKNATDYQESGEYSKAIAQFSSLYNSNVKSLDYVSQPTPNDGRVISLSIQSEDSLQTSSTSDASDIWKKTLNNIHSVVDFNSGDVVHLTLSDPGQAESVSTILSSESDLENAMNLPEGIWSTMSGYLTNQNFMFLKATQTNFVLNSTLNQSVLTVVVDQSITSENDIARQVYMGARNSNSKMLIPGNYNTYFTTSENSAPFLSLYATSRDW